MHGHVSSPHTGEHGRVRRVLVTPYLYLPDLVGQEDEIPDTRIKMTAQGARVREDCLGSQFAGTQTVMMEGMAGEREAADIH